MKSNEAKCLRMCADELRGCWLSPRARSVGRKLAKLADTCEERDTPSKKRDGSARTRGRAARESMGSVAPGFTLPDPVTRERGSGELGFYVEKLRTMGSWARASVEFVLSHGDWTALKSTPEWMALAGFLAQPDGSDFRIATPAGSVDALMEDAAISVGSFDAVPREQPWADVVFWIGEREWSWFGGSKQWSAIQRFIAEHAKC